MTGLHADLPRKNCGTIAEHADNASPPGMQHLLSRARWHADRLRDDIRNFAMRGLAAAVVAAGAGLALVLGAIEVDRVVISHLTAPVIAAGIFLLRRSRY